MAFFVLVGGLVAAGTSAARADCAAGAVWAWPAVNEPIDRAGRIVLSAYGADQAWVLDVSRLSPRLVSGGHSVPLRVVETHRGSFEVAQVVLEAAQPLRAGRSYRLALRGRPTPTVWAGEKHSPLAWQVTASSSAGAPRFRAPPRVVRTSFTSFGCGPAIYAHLAVAVDAPARTIFRVRLTPIAGGATVEYLLPAQDGSLDVGHGMCHGPFELDPGVRYRVELSAIGTTGRETAAPGGPLFVTGPTP